MLPFKVGYLEVIRLERGPIIKIRVHNEEDNHILKEKEVNETYIERKNDREDQPSSRIQKWFYLQSDTVVELHLNMNKQNTTQIRRVNNIQSLSNLRTSNTYIQVKYKK